MPAMRHLEKQLTTHQSPVRILLIVIFSTAVFEILVMLVINFFLPLHSIWAKVFIDPALLIVLLPPVLYFFVFRPLVSHIDVRKQAEESLRESETKYRTLFECANDSIFIVDPPTHRILDVNQNAARRLGYTREELLQLRFDDISTPLAATRTEVLIRELQETGHIITEHAHRRKDGTEMPVEISSRIIEVNGRIVFQGFVRDITERKQAEKQIKDALAEKEVLVKEIHHRVKNNLQAIIYLIDMQAGAITDSQTLRMLRDLQGRAGAMALVHEKLYQSQNLAQIDFGAYLEELATGVFHSFETNRDIALRIDAAKVFMSVDQAIPCGLMVSELITNAMKYAFPTAAARESRKGEDELFIEFRIDEQAEEKAVTLIVGDNGIGLSPELDWRTTRSLGLRLVNLWATHQLGGRLDVDTQSGTIFTISFAKRK